MARIILALALCSTFAIPFVWSRRVSQGGSKLDSADVAQQPQDGAIFVYNFEHGTDEEALKKHFGVVGAIKDLRFQGRGAAVITYKKVYAATRAVNELNGQPLKDQSRNVVVKLNDPDRQGQGAKSKEIVSADVAQQPQDGSIFVYNFEHGTDEEAVKKHFGAVGAIKELRFQGRGAAVITYKKVYAATRAVNELNGQPLKDQSRNVVVKLNDPDREGQGAKSKKEDSDKGKTKVSGKGDSKPTGRTIFVKGLEPATDDAALMKHFGTVGAIEDHYFASPISAVITYVKVSSAQQAVAKLDGSVLSSQKCYVTVKLDDRDQNGAQQSEPSPPGAGSGRGIYVSGFDFRTTGAVLEKHFGSVGKVKSCHFQSKGAAVVTFAKAGSAQRAVTELGGTTMDGQHRYVAVKLDNPEHKVQKQLEEEATSKGARKRV